MKRQIGVFLVALILAQSFTPFLWAQVQPAAEVRQYTWQEKLKRGALNIVTSPVEVARQIHITSEEKNLLVGWTIGLVHGLGSGLLRFGAGAIDLVTFPWGFPESDRAPLIDPEYVWEKPGPKYV